MRLPLYIVQALGYRAWYVEFCPLRIQSQDPTPEMLFPLHIKNLMEFFNI